MTTAAGGGRPRSRRLFVAIDVPAPERLDGVLDRLRRGDLRVPPTDRLHLTLLFLGAVDHAAVADVEGGVAAVAQRHAPLELAFTGNVGRFGRGVVWAELAPSGGLEVLAADLRREIRATGVAVEDRAFHPHVTLARAGRRRVRPADTSALPVPPLAWRVEEIRLVDSAVGSRPAAWTTLGRYRLTGEESAVADA